MPRYVFIISDGTGITAQNLCQSLLTQFEDIRFETITLPYIDTNEKAIEAVNKINTNYKTNKQRPLIFSTLVNTKIRKIINRSAGMMHDLFYTFIEPLEKELKTKSSHTVGRSHGLRDKQSYKHRIDALNYTLEHDDGVRLKDYDKADIILLGVSRSGKTPTSLYLAMQFGLLVANYPLTEDDDCFTKLPECLRPYKKTLFGLTIDPERLKQIREERRGGSRYASIEQCRLEVGEVESMFRKEDLLYLNTTSYSIEEIATRILAETGLQRRIN